MAFSWWFMFALKVAVSMRLLLVFHLNNLMQQYQNTLHCSPVKNVWLQVGLKDFMCRIMFPCKAGGENNMLCGRIHQEHGVLRTET